MLALAALATLVPGGQTSPPGFAAGTRADITETGGDRYVGEVPPDEPIDFTINLRLPGRDQLQQFLGELSDPASPEYRRFITPTTFGVRYGLPDAELARLEQELTDRGLTILERFPQRTSIGLRGSAGSIAALFGSPLVMFRDDTGREYRRPVRIPAIPAELQGDIAGVSGLDTSAYHVPLAGLLFDVPATGLQAAGIARAYEMTRLRSAASLGAGEYVAVVSFDTFLPSDIDKFDAAAGITGPKVEKVSVGTPLTKPGKATVEVNLDIDTIRMIAPSVQVLNFETGDNELTNGDMVARIVRDGRAKIATISWGWCASKQLEIYGTNALQAEDAQMAAARAAGVNVFLASGDSGPYGCRHGDITDIKVDPEATGTSPNVIDVGGTRLFVREDDSYLDEVAWEQPLSGGGGGGGQTMTFPRPAWQAGPGVANKDSNGFRQSPDVSGPADCQSAFFVYFTDPASGEAQSGAQGCGTSAASPFWAAITVLIQGYAHAQGIKELGHLTPTLYALAASAPPDTLFHDVIRGANLGFDAGPGWDFATGLGSPRVDPLADAIVAYLKAP